MHEPRLQQLRLRKYRRAPLSKHSLIGILKNDLQLVLPDGAEIMAVERLANGLNSVSLTVFHPAFEIVPVNVDPKLDPGLAQIRRREGFDQEAGA